MASGEAKFDVAYDPAERVLRWSMRGFWSMPDVAAFKRGLDDAVAHLGPPPYTFDGLCDSRAFPIQSAEVSAALGEDTRMDGVRWRGRFALVLGSMMSKLQVQRTLKGPNIRAFLSMTEAEAWLKQKAVDPV